MKKLVLLLFGSAATVLASCSHFTYSDANHLQKGQTIEEVADLVSKGPKNTFEISLPSSPNIKYVIEQYIVKAGEYEQAFFCVYQGGKLLYWGYPFEFRRHPDATLNEIGNAAITAYNRVIQ